MRWFTSDLHFGHENIIRYCGRPFASVEAMNLGLVSRWNETVGLSDEVWVLGDFAMGRIDESLRLVGLLNGTKTLVPGNHDRCWEGHRRGSDHWTEQYLAAGFDGIVRAPVSLELDGRTVLAGHFPYGGDSRDEDRFVEHRPVDGGRWLLHGHVHERWRQSARQLNVGVDAWGGRPVSDSELTVLIHAGPGDLAPLSWTADLDG
jgi:calcineurin-like phosphoesterase family protein